jgi:hypothetical protein
VQAANRNRIDPQQDAQLSVCGNRGRKAIDTDSVRTELARQNDHRHGLDRPRRELSAEEIQKIGG